MKNSDNKAELYSLLIGFLHQRSIKDCDILVHITMNEHVLSNREPAFFEPCNHIEADTRVAVFVNDAVVSGASRVLVRTGDSDVLFILIGQYKVLLEKNEDLKLYIQMSTSSSTYHLDIVKIARYIRTDYPFYTLILGVITRPVSIK